MQVYHTTRVCCLINSVQLGSAVMWLVSCCTTSTVAAAQCTTRSMNCKQRRIYKPTAIIASCLAICFWTVPTVHRYVYMMYCFMHCLNSEALYCAVMALVTHRPSFTTWLGMKKTIKKLLWQFQASLQCRCHMLVVDQERCHMLAFLSQSEQGRGAHDLHYWLLFLYKAAQLRWRCN